VARSRALFLNQLEGQLARTMVVRRLGTTVGTTAGAVFTGKLTHRAVGGNAPKARHAMINTRMTRIYTAQ
jgi:hypothetical protein